MATERSGTTRREDLACSFSATVVIRKSTPPVASTDCGWPYMR